MAGGGVRSYHVDPEHLKDTTIQVGIEHEMKAHLEQSPTLSQRPPTDYEHTAKSIHQPFATVHPTLAANCLLRTNTSSYLVHVHYLLVFKTWQGRSQGAVQSCSQEGK